MAAEATIPTKRAGSIDGADEYVDIGELVMDEGVTSQAMFSALPRAAALSLDVKT